VETDPATAHHHIPVPYEFSVICIEHMPIENKLGICTIRNRMQTKFAVEIVISHNVTRPITASACNQYINKPLVYWYGQACNHKISLIISFTLTDLTSPLFSNLTGLQYYLVLYQSNKEDLSFLL